MKIVGAAMRLQQGYKVFRKDWKDAYLWMVTMNVKALVKPVGDGSEGPADGPGQSAEDPKGIHDESGNEVAERRIILIKTPTGQGPWTPQPEDLMAEDWEEVAKGPVED